MRKVSKTLVVIALIAVLPGVALFAGGTQGSDDAGPGAMQSGMYGEAPMLAAMVEAGDLPPVADRLPEEPKVAVAIEEVGDYSDQLRVLGRSATGGDVINDQFAANLFELQLDGLGAEGNLASGFEMNADQTAITVYLREGARWSDGDPFTTEDVEFMYNGIHWTDQIRSWGTGGINDIEIIDEYTFQWKNVSGVSSFAYNNMPNWFSGQFVSYHPAHYLKPFHADYNEDAPEMAEEEGYESWQAMLLDKYFWNQPHVGLPRMAPWILVEETPNASQWQRNPYYWKVDEEGKQLPYFDEVLLSITNQDNYDLKVIAGEADIAYDRVSLPNVQLYRENERSGDYTTHLWPGTWWSNFNVSFNAFHPDDYKHELERDIRFRQALNLAVDRQDVNETLFFGLAEPRQVAPIESEPYYQEDWGTYYAQYDPEQANQLLDEIGLDKRDSDGFRVREDNGQTLSWVIEYSNDAFTPGLELIAEFFNEVGIKTTIRIQEPGVLQERMFQTQHDMIVFPGGSGPQMHNGPFVRNWWNYTYDTYLHLSHEYGSDPLPENWIDVSPKPETAVELGWEISGEPAPDWFKELWYMNTEFQGLEPGTPEHIELGEELGELRVKMLWDVGVIGNAPSPFVVKNNIGNAPEPGYLPGIPLGQRVASQFNDQLFRR